MLMLMLIALGVLTAAAGAAAVFSGDGFGLEQAASSTNAVAEMTFMQGFNGFMARSMPRARRSFPRRDTQMELAHSRIRYADCRGRPSRMFAHPAAIQSKGDAWPTRRSAHDSPGAKR